MDAGQLVSDDIVLGLIRDRLSRADAAKGFILDGFPRNIDQANSLSALLDELGQPLDAVLLLDVRKQTLMQRLAGRRICPKCGTVYNVHSMPAGATDLRARRRRAVSAARRQGRSHRQAPGSLRSADPAAGRALFEASACCASVAGEGRARRGVRAHGGRRADAAGAVLQGQSEAHARQGQRRRRSSPAAAASRRKRAAQARRRRRPRRKFAREGEGEAKAGARPSHAPPKRAAKRGTQARAEAKAVAATSRALRKISHGEAQDQCAAKAGRAPRHSS